MFSTIPLVLEIRPNCVADYSVEFTTIASDSRWNNESLRGEVLMTLSRMSWLQKMSRRAWTRLSHQRLGWITVCESAVGSSPAALPPPLARASSESMHPIPSPMPPERNPCSLARPVSHKQDTTAEFQPELAFTVARPFTFLHPVPCGQKSRLTINSGDPGAPKPLPRLYPRTGFS